MATAPPPIPPGLDIHESKQGSLYASSIVTFVIALITVVLRFFGRKLASTHIGLDDWLIIPATIVAAVQMFITCAWAVPAGFGAHIWVLPPEALVTWAKFIFTNIITYALAIALIKYSLLALYWRLFGINRGIRIPAIALGCIVTAWMIAVIFVGVFECIPPAVYWERFSPDYMGGPPKCYVHEEPFFYGVAIPNIITDLALLALPLPFLWTLQMKKSQKALVSSIFLLGLMVTVVSCIRLAVIVDQDLNSPDVTYNTANSVMLTNIEINVALICACLPAFRPVIALLIQGYETLSRLSGSRRSSRSTSRKNTSNLHDGSDRSEHSDNIELTNSDGSTRANSHDVVKQKSMTYSREESQV